MFANCGWSVASLRRNLLTVLVFIGHTSVRLNAANEI